MLKSLTEKILAAPLLNAESDPEFQRDAFQIVQNNAFSLRPWGRPRGVWLVDDREEERVNLKALSDAIDAADRALIVVFAANGFRHPGVREMLPSVTSINAALDSSDTVLFIKADYGRAMSWANIMTRSRCPTRVLFDDHAIDCKVA